MTKLLRSKNIKIAFAESCSGGMLASIITSYSGASDFFDSCCVTYSNQAKNEILGVSYDTLKKYGAVSKETAIEMAEKLLKLRKTDLTLAITGIAGPNSDDSKKPVGLVYIAIATKNNSKVMQYNFYGNRRKIQKITCLNALNLLLTEVKNNYHG